MRVDTFELLDEYISGTSTAWLTPTSLNEKIGRGDVFSFTASAYNASSPAPQVVVQPEHSADGQNWAALGTAINASLASNTFTFGQVDIFSMMLHFVRLKVTITNNGTSCRLKLHGTTRCY